MEIQRIHDYKDKRFSENTLKQHGCFLVNDEPFEIEIISEFEAIIHGKNMKYFEELIKEFRFYAPHITTFYDSSRRIVQKLTKLEILEIKLSEIQPSQFYVDKEKIDAIASFIGKEEDIIVQVIKYGNRYISLDGHTRLYYAVMRGFENVRAVISESNDYIYDFAKEAVRRGITTPHDLILVEHEEYCEKWYTYCDEYFGRK